MLDQFDLMPSRLIREAACAEHLARRAAEKALDSEIASAKRLSDAYIRLRVILKAFDTPHAPSPREVWDHTEARARELIETEKSQHVCGLSWFDPIHGDTCPGCVQRAS